MNIKKRLTKDGEFYFTINAMNGRLIATSENYKTRAGVEGAISLVAVRIHDARVIDLTHQDRRNHQ